MEEQRSPNWFVRALSLLLLILLACLVTASFILSVPKFIISSGIIIVILVMTVLVLAEVFNTLSIGKLIILSRQIKDTEARKDEIKKDNVELRSALLNLATNVHQSQVTTNISGADLPLLRQALGVVPATQTKSDEDTEDREQREAHAAVASRDDWAVRRRLYRKLDEHLLQKFIERYSLTGLDLLKDVEFGTGIESIDPIMDRRVVYDGYIKTSQKEYFIEARANGMFHPMWADRMYVMLAKVFFYRQAKKVEAELVLLVPELPEGLDERHDRWHDARSLGRFQPAIGSGLLRVESFAVTKAEYDGMRELATSSGGE